MKTFKPFNQLVREFLADQDVRANTRNNYRVTLGLFTRWCVTNDVDVTTIRRADIIIYKNYLQGRHPATTVDSYLASVRKLFKWLEASGLYDNIAAGVHNPRRYKGHRKSYLQVEQVEKLLSSIDRSTLTGLRDYAIIYLMVRTGMRCTEIATLNLDNIHNSGGACYIELMRKGMKDSNEREQLGITQGIYSVIEEYLGSREVECNALFSNHHYVHERPLRDQYVGELIKKRLKACGLHTRKITAHSLRHTAAITALRAGAPIYDVAQMLGHASVETTQIYLSAIEAELKLNNSAVRAIDDKFNTAKETPT